jgi:glyoxylase-like metal-dependent hydrolase (beta-lactamase superfamily II)/rhodanese-related sulfurtransferase
MILQQYYLACLAQASYLIADAKTRRAVVVDPRRDVDEYLAEARARGLTIEHVLLTHFHADFVSGHLELQEATGATIHMGSHADPEFAFVPMGNGSRLSLGDVQLEVLETPGHTPESICIVVHDGSGGRPHAVLTGDTLFLGDVGRPDLMASVGMSPRQLAAQLYRSLHEKLLPLPDETLVYPGHGAGSMCGKNLSSDTVSTMGAQRRLNYALQPMSEDRFIELVTADQMEAPPYFAHDAEMNRSQRGTLDHALQRGLRPLSLDEALALRAGGAQLLDTRAGESFARAHLTGSLNIGLGGSYASWAGTLLDHDRPIVVISEAGHEHEAVMRLGRIGFDQVAGVLEGGAEVLAQHPQHASNLDRVTPQELSASLAGQRRPFLLDVRTGREWGDKRIADAVHVPLSQLRERLGELPTARAIVVHCAGGYRSSMAASLLGTRGFQQVGELAGGIDAWARAGLPVQAGVPV